MAKIRGNQDGFNGRNETYNVGNRKNIPRHQIVSEIKNGLHPDYHIYHRKNQEYVRDNPGRNRHPAPSSSSNRPANSCYGIGMRV